MTVAAGREQGMSLSSETAEVGPTSQEEAFVDRVKALTAEQWDDVIRLWDYTLGAVGEDEVKAADARARQATMHRTDLDPAAQHAFVRAREDLDRYFKTAGPTANRDIAEAAADLALWAVTGLLFLSDSDFYTLYLPFATAIRYGSLPPTGSVSTPPGEEPRGE